jgi:hypothetical protein
MTIGDLIQVRSFPAVVQAADIRALRTGSQTGRGTLDETQPLSHHICGFV